MAGSFYPSDPAELEAAVRGLLGDAPAPPAGRPPPLALIAPHAGFPYSGPVAASAFRCLAPRRGRVRRFLLLGPSHFVPLRGLAAPSSTALRTPLGDVPVDRATVERLLELPGVGIDDRAHAREHSLEVELPFLQVALGPVAVVPLVVGDATPEEVAGVIRAFAPATDAPVLVSTDLSHYLTYRAAAERDAATASAVEALDEERIGPEDACGRAPLRGLLRWARDEGLAVRRLDLRSSGDTAGPRDRVVGYGAWSLAGE